MKGEVARVVIHATRVHEAKRVPHGLRAQYLLTCDGTDSSIGQCGCHHTA